MIKAPGDPVYAGSINYDASIDMRATRTEQDSTVARIVKLVQEAQGRRATVERWADQFARYYTPTMMAIAVGVALVPPMAGSLAWSESIYRALVLLLIACPCALVISTPVSIVAALTAAARNGVLIKGGVFLEIAGRIGAVALDKTGTLTQGTPTVGRVVAFGDIAEDTVLTRAAAIEAHSTHPIAKAITRCAQERGMAIPETTAAEAAPGLGASAWVEGREFWLGNRRMVIQRGHGETPIEALLETDDSPENAWVFVGDSDRVYGAIQVHDTLREDSADAVATLRDRLGIRVLLVTGDSTRAARAVAEATGVEEVFAEQLPEDKLAVIERAKERHGVCAMVGDGINDAPAMASASLGIAMGVAGTDTALETADIALMNDDLRKIPWLIRHSRRTMRIVTQNVAIALGLKLAVLALAFAGYTTLWLAVLADMGASLLVIGNSLRLLALRSGH